MNTYFNAMRKSFAEEVDRALVSSTFTLPLGPSAWLMAFCNYHQCPRPRLVLGMESDGSLFGLGCPPCGDSPLLMRYIPYHDQDLFMIKRIRAQSGTY